jgi:uncharacterized protein (TIGR02118 family)
LSCKIVALLAERGGAPKLAVRNTVLYADPTNALLAEQAGAEPRPERNAGVVLAWPGDDAARAEAEVALAPHAKSIHCMREIVHWDELGPVGAESIVLVYVVRRRADLSFDDFAAHYRERHAPLARIHHPGIARYVQNFPLSGDASDVDAVSELWFASEHDARARFYRDDESRRVIAEEVRRFIDLRSSLAFAARAAG